MSDVFFSMDIPDLQGLIKQLDMFDENQNKAVRKALHKIGKNIQQAQRRKISGIAGGDKLSKAINVGNVYTTKKGSLGITSGYQTEAFKMDSDGFNPGIVGMVREFGRPGQSPERKGDKMTQTRKRIPNKKTAKRKNWEKAIPTKVEISKGTIQPLSHIRAGFDETLEQNVQLMVDAVNEVIDKTGGGT